LVDTNIENDDATDYLSVQLMYDNDITIVSESETANSSDSSTRMELKSDDVEEFFLQLDATERSDWNNNERNSSSSTTQRLQVDADNSSTEALK
jgi:hypothetical protein